MKNEDERSETWMKMKTVSDSYMAMMLRKKKKEKEIPHSIKAHIMWELIKLTKAFIFETYGLKSAM